MLKNFYKTIFIKKLTNHNKSIKITNENVCFGCGIFFSLDKKKKKFNNDTQIKLTVSINTAFIFYVPKDTQVYCFKSDKKMLFLLTIVNTKSLFLVEKCSNNKLETNLRVKFNNKIFTVYYYQKIIKKIFTIIFFMLCNKLKIRLITKRTLRKYITIFKQIIIYFE